MRFKLIILLYLFNHFASFGESVQHSHLNNSHTVSISHQSGFSLGDLYFDNTDDDLIDIQKKFQQLYYLPLFYSVISYRLPLISTHLSSHPKDHSQSLLYKICVLRI